MTNKKILLTLIIMLLLLPACQAETAAPDASTEAETAVSAPDSNDADIATDETDESEAMVDDSAEMASDTHDDMAETGMEETDTAAGMTADWATTSLTNARTGETFTLADFLGQTVFVEPMATWCTNCLRQLGNVRDAQAQLADEDVAFIVLSVETNIDDSELAAYATDQGFDFTFAVASPELLEQLVAQFGQSIVNPPSTPHFIISPDGMAGELDTGFESTDELVAQIQSAGQ